MSLPGSDHTKERTDVPTLTQEILSQLPDIPQFLPWKVRMRFEAGTFPRKANCVEVRGYDGELSLAEAAKLVDWGQQFARAYLDTLVPQEGSEGPRVVIRMTVWLRQRPNRFLTVESFEVKFDDPPQKDERTV